jgi:protein phosphatase
MKLIAAGLTDPGKIRKNNEDSYWVDAELGLLLVADGMGGHAAGEVASQMAVDVIRDQVAQGLQTGRIPSVGERPLHLSQKGQLLTAALHMANEVVYSASQERPEKKGMGTTIVAVLVDNNKFVVAHVGDSRLYLFRNNSLRQLTRDHSLVAEQVAKGLLTPEQAEASEMKNVLTRALGIKPELDLDVEEHPLQPEDTILLCTDGLCRMAEDRVIEEELKRLSDPNDICHNLVALAVERGGKDNVTVVAGRTHAVSWLDRLKTWRQGKNGA